MESSYQRSEADRGHKVEITVNHQRINIRAARHPVSEIKALAHVPLADDLEQVVHGKLVPLGDDATVEIKGGERFVSHPKDAGSS